VCADVGSTYTKVAVVDLDAGELAGRADHPTTTGDDVLRGLDAAVAAACAGLGRAAADAPWYVCSSAGGGLRLAVVGYEPLITARAGHRVGLSAGARVVHVAAGRLDAAAVRALRADRPDLVLLVGGTDGGDADVLRHNADRLARARLRLPVVVAGNADARDDVTAALAAAGVPVTATANVLPALGVLEPGPARAAIRDVFLRHVIGGKRLSRGRRFPALVRAATPDAVLAAVELLADTAGVDLAVVDVGGATTDVYTALTPDPEEHGRVRAEAAGTLWRARTVEGDLGVRAGAPGVVAAARAERLSGVDAGLEEAAARRAADPGFAATGDREREVDRRLVELAAVIAVRRHARAEPDGGPGRDLRAVRWLVGSGGVLRHAPRRRARAALAAVLADAGGGWRVPRAAEVVVDDRYVLAAAGLLAGPEPAAASALLRRHLIG
jgi:uncharacterized protein (TIGR01319 family)